jgi:hypothetical protein
MCGLRSTAEDNQSAVDVVVCCGSGKPERNTEA